MSEIMFFLSAICFSIGMYGDFIGFSVDLPIDPYIFALWGLGTSISFQLDKVIKKLKSRR